MKLKILAIFLIILFASVVNYGQIQGINARREFSGAGAPTLSCNPGPPWRDIYIRTSDNSEYQCTAAPNTWTKVTSGSPATSGITNSAGANQVAVSDGTNLTGSSGLTFVAPSVSTTGAAVIAGTALSPTADDGAPASVILMVTGPAGQASSSTGSEAFGGLGGDIFMTAGSGGNQTGAGADGAAGGAGSLYMQAGNGGAATAAGGSRGGGTGGEVELVAGVGGAAAGASAPGTGGAIEIRSGAGGVATLAGQDSRIGGTITILSGNGGSKTNAGTSGAGGEVSIDTGPPGSASGGGASGIGGVINIGISNASTITLGGGSASAASMSASTINVVAGTTITNTAITSISNATPLFTLTTGSTPISKHLSATATLNFASQVGVGCENLTITVTGAAVGDTVAIGIPNASIVTNGVFYGWVSATNTVSVKFCAVVSGDPASGTFRADVWQH